ncbi:flagellar biosynthesis protein FlhB [Sanguibacter sp. HDW7]|uniref:EscU/YscU/HrcU family type III secretion system export apparatus switch protein n=1 Tax=Sanguibacter sp. HDW7 TaxID=2714931 RepID=UPI0014090E31|nr:EscU/YscU/HrcU family type III secretion system export apparatus switch protein [Sanguibacter sp. HDW7]QIK84292.1 EscU/YscU/HrcU family type III secretion system export apparatus switch protein [Sanguibacter sp. HDW7]
MADAPGGGEKTEKATPQRMKKLRKDGALQRSQDLSAWLGVGAAAIMLPGVVASGRAAGEAQLATLDDVISDPSPERALAALTDGLGSVLGTLTPVLVVVVLAAVVANVAQGGLHVSTKKLKPSFKQLNVVQGLKRVFSVQSLWQGLKALLKTVVVGLVLWQAVGSIVPQLTAAGGHSLMSLLGIAGGAVRALVVGAVAAGLGLAVLDLVVVVRKNRKQSRMSRQEIKEEHKQSEGDPLLKGQIRSRQLAMSRNRMIADVAGADVVVVNPTHVAVALRYEPGTGAPRLVAAGKGALAARIREAGESHRVPLVHDVPLARVIYASCRVGEEIPTELFTAVAQVLAFVMALKQRGAGQGHHTMPKTTAVPAMSRADRLRSRREGQRRAREPRTSQPSPPPADGASVSRATDDPQESVR